MPPTRSQSLNPIFQLEVRTSKGFNAILVVAPEATTRFFEPRVVPYSIRDDIKADLDRKEMLIILEHVTHSSGLL